MNKIILCAALASLATAASAEEWQLTAGAGNAFASYAEVHIVDSSGHEVLKTYADRLGRVGAALPQGAYRVTAKTPDGRTVSADVRIGGTSGPQTLALK